MRSPAFVAEQFAIWYVVFLNKDLMYIKQKFYVSVHNGYMLASGWTIVFESLRYMRDMGLTDRMVLDRLKSSSKLRSVYLLAYELLQKLVSVGQQRLRSIVRNTGKYLIYGFNEVDPLSLLLYCCARTLSCLLQGQQRIEGSPRI